MKQRSQFFFMDKKKEKGEGLGTPPISQLPAGTFL
jgi:hypothetical protein